MVYQIIVDNKLLKKKIKSEFVKSLGLLFNHRGFQANFNIK